MTNREAKDTLKAIAISFVVGLLLGWIFGLLYYDNINKTKCQEQKKQLHTFSRNHTFSEYRVSPN